MISFFFLITVMLDVVNFHIDSGSCYLARSNAPAYAPNQASQAGLVLATSSKRVGQDGDVWAPPQANTLPSR